MLFDEIDNKRMAEITHRLLFGNKIEQATHYKEDINYLHDKIESQKSIVDSLEATKDIDKDACMNFMWELSNLLVKYDIRFAMPC
jgi:hypothetical protein